MRAVLLIFALLFVNSCATLGEIARGDRPTFDFRRVELSGWSLEGVVLGVVYEIDNPYSSALKLAKVDYALDVDGRQVFDGSPNLGIRIPAKRRREIVFPARIRFADVLPAARSIFLKDRFAYRARGSVGIDTPVGVVSFPISKSGNFDSPKLPKVELVDVKAPRVTATGAELRVLLDVKNDNPFPLPIEGIRYALAVNGAKVGSGNARGKRVASGRKQRLELPLQLSLVQAGAGARSLLSGKPVKVGLDGSFDFGSTSGPLDVARKIVLER